MKSKILMMVSMLFTALVLVNSASAQGRAEKVSLPCQVSQIEQPTVPGAPKPMVVKLEARIKNDTGGWLAEGKTVYYQLKVVKNPGEAIRTAVLSEMVPDGSHAKIWEGAFPSSLVSSPKICIAWYLK